MNNNILKIHMHLLNVYKLYFITLLVKIWPQTITLNCLFIVRSY